MRHESINGVDTDRREELARAFSAERPRLVSLAYRMIGSLADAEDVVQETWIRLQRAAADPSTAPRDQPAWLTTTATRLALDHFRAAGRRNETYVGPWLPELRVAPAHQQRGDPEQAAALADELSFALLVVLESLSPAQRAAFILHDTFGVPFEQVAEVLGRTPAAVRQLASRARNQVAATAPRGDADAVTHQRVVEAFQVASAGGDLLALVELLDPSVVYRADGGGVVPAARKVVRGADAVARLVLGVNARVEPDVIVDVRIVNAAPGLVFSRAGTIVGVVAFDVTGEGRIAALDVQMNPAKVARVRLP
jgi:RNA polymerase sigma-70 factor (ECF subfamily)